MGSLSANQEAEIDAVTAEANARIKSILADESLTDAEKKAAIAAVDKHARAALQDLASRQVACHTCDFRN